MDNFSFGMNGAQINSIAFKCMIGLAQIAYHSYPGKRANHSDGLSHQTVSKEEQVSQHKFSLLFHKEGE